MKFQATSLAGAYLLELNRLEDSRGFFARSFCQQEFEAHGLNPAVAQCNIAYNHQAGTVRGLHYQRPPAAECKLVRCSKGAIYDVIVDLRPESPTYLQHVGALLSEENRLALYVPEMFAHGYQTLCDACEIHYQVSTPYTPGVEAGLRYNDPRLAIAWPQPCELISEKDANWPLLPA